ncbi:MAG TPA: hypothetical protein DDW30_05485 [Clostridiales bacterium]|nr:hypothetical protein [Clostridiales bacterium]
MTRLFRLCAVLLACLLLPLSLFACKTKSDENNGSESVSTDPMQGSVTPEITGADVTTVPEIPEIPEVPNKENAMVITSEKLLELIRNGALAENGDYAVTDGIGIVFDSADRGKTYDLRGARIRIAVPVGKAAIGVQKAKNLTLKNGYISVYGGTAIDTTTARSIVLSALHISGNAQNAFVLGGESVTLSESTVCPDADGTLDVAVVATGDEVLITDCNLQKAKVGIQGKVADAMIAENNLLTDCETAFLLESHDCTVWYNTVTGGKYGVYAAFEKAEISAAMGTGYNLLVAQNKISGAETSVLMDGASNSVVLLNELENATVQNGINVYINENKVSGKLMLAKNNYLIANKNEGTVNASENSNFNGDNVTDLTKRNKVGANEELVPHLNEEQFVGMSRKRKVKTAKTESETLYAYLKEQLAEKDCVIIPPGAYFNDPTKLYDLSDKTIYAYGVLNELYQSKTETAMYFERCSNVTLKGMFFGNVLYPHTQGTVISKGQMSIKFRVDPGYLENFCDTSNFGNRAKGFLFREGSLYPYTDFYYSSKSYDAATNLNTINNSSECNGALVGDRVAMRNDYGGGALSMKYCTEMKIEDVTVNSCSGFAESDWQNDVAPVLHRLALSAGPAPVLDSTKSYAGYEDVIWTDSYGRLRSAKPLNTSCDATHSTSARVGVKLISSRLEMMNDDGGNINANYGMAESYDSATKTLTYANCNVNSYQRLPADFRAGDTVLLYTVNGKFVGETTVTSATVLSRDSDNIKERRYQVQLAEDITLPDGTVVSATDVSKLDRSEYDRVVVVQNLSASGSGFLWDNVLLHNAESFGVRIKAAGGTIRNCTFDHVVQGGINMIPEFQWWPECGYARDVYILNNEFYGVGLKSTLNENFQTRAQYVPIMARYTPYDDSDKAFVNGNNSADPDYCMHRNIVIEGNIFGDSYSRYDISLASVMGVKITNNTFLAPNEQAKRADNGAPILLFSGNDIAVEGNTFPDGVTNPIEDRGSSNGVKNTENVVVRSTPATPSGGKKEDSDELPISWEN